MSIMRILQSIVFVTLVLIVYIGMHWFCYWRIAEGLHLAETARIWLKLSFVILALTFIAGEFVGRLTKFDQLLMLGYIWLGVLSIALTVLFIFWLPLIFRPQWDTGVTIIGLVTVLLVSGYALVNGTRYPRITQLQMTIDQLPNGLSGFKLVQISDLHLGDTASIEYIQHIAGQIGALAPDAVVMTGDLIDGSYKKLQRYIPVLQQIRAKYGVYAITGNHDFYSGVKHFERIVREAGWVLLRNSKTTIAGALTLIGMDDDTGSEFGFANQREQALAGLNPEQANILLYHRPVYLKMIAQRGIQLQLSGHSHAGQIPPLDFLVWLTFRYSFGLYHKDGTTIYTTCGTGTWGPPMRLFSRNEIVCLTLRSPQIASVAMADK